jgi:Fic family protein
MEQLPEIIYASSDPVESRRIGQLAEDGKIRSLVPRVYSSNLVDDPAIVIRRNIWQMLSHLFPGTLLSHRTALEFAISPKGNIYLTGTSRRVWYWPGIAIRFAAGAEPLESDTAFYDSLRVSSLERALLENLSPSRIVNGERRTVEREVVESRLLDYLHTRGEEALNTLRDNARIVARELSMKKEFAQLDQIISALMSTKPLEGLTSNRAIAHVLGMPYDSARIELFQILASALHSRTFATYPEKTKSETAFRNMAFYEAYFSNYIEGTTFLVEEARQIVYEDMTIPMRTADTHDIKGTFTLCASRNEMQEVPRSDENLFALLRNRHRVLMSGRPDKNPGAFKSMSNRAGNTVFVEPAFILGTMAEGLKIYQGFRDPVARALFMMFMISEIHPFDDGNGRIARIMMNAELVYAGYSKILIPTVYREDYLLALRRLSRKREPDAYIKMMIRALSFSHQLDPVHLDLLQEQLENANAFKEGDEGKLIV